MSVNINILIISMTTRYRLYFSEILNHSVGWVFDTNKTQDLKNVPTKNTSQNLDCQLDQTNTLNDYSTVTDFFCLDVTHPDTKIKESEFEVIFTCNITIQTSKLTKTFHYNTYQKELYELVRKLRDEEGYSYKRISNYLIMNDYKTVRSKKPIFSNYVYSIYKKGKIRESRVYRIFPVIINDVNLRVRLINSTKRNE